jgi:hypothetical protein
MSLLVRRREVRHTRRTPKCQKNVPASGTLRTLRSKSQKNVPASGTRVQHRYPPKSGKRMSLLVGRTPSLCRFSVAALKVSKECPCKWDHGRPQSGKRMSLIVGPYKKWLDPKWQKNVLASGTSIRASISKSVK